MKCGDCKYWITGEKTVYGDGEEITNKTFPQGIGRCGQLSMDTKEDFGCKLFEEGHEHLTITVKEGATWQNWHFGPCPNCDGVGCHMVELRPACQRCAGLGKVRYYDDGYIADATWDHPKEKEEKKRLGIWGKPGLEGTSLAPVTKRNEGLVEQ